MSEEKSNAVKSSAIRLKISANLAFGGLAILSSMGKSVETEEVLLQCFFKFFSDYRPTQEHTICSIGVKEQL